MNHLFEETNHLSEDVGRRWIIRLKKRNHANETYLGFADLLFGAHQNRFVFFSDCLRFPRLPHVMYSKLCWASFESIGANTQNMRWEGWGQHQRFGGSSATLRNHAKHEWWGLGMFGKSKGYWPIAKSIRNIFRCLWQRWSILKSLKMSPPHPPQTSTFDEQIDFLWFSQIP